MYKSNLDRLRDEELKEIEILKMKETKKDFFKQLGLVTLTERYDINKSKKAKTMSKATTSTAVTASSLSPNKIYISNEQIKTENDEKSNDQTNGTKHIHEYSPIMTRKRARLSNLNEDTSIKNLNDIERFQTKLSLIKAKQQLNMTTKGLDISLKRHNSNEHDDCITLTCSTSESIIISNCTLCNNKICHTKILCTRCNSQYHNKCLNKQDNQLWCLKCQNSNIETSSKTTDIPKYLPSFLLKCKYENELSQTKEHLFALKLNLSVLSENLKNLNEKHEMLNGERQKLESENKNLTHKMSIYKMVLRKLLDT